MKGLTPFPVELLNRSSCKTEYNSTGSDPYKPVALTKVMTVTGQSLGIGLNGIADYSTQLPFLNLFKTARSWIPHSDTQWDTQESAQLDLDSNGWVRSLPATQTNAQPPKYTHVGTLMLTDIPEAYPTGRYVVLYDGVGTLNYRGAAQKNEALSSPGRDVIEVNGSGAGVDLRITQTDPMQTGDYLRNIRVYREADLPLVDLGLEFNPNFLQKIKDFGTLRFMDWMQTNYSNQQEWTQRSTASQANWATENGVPVEIMVELANQTGTSPWFNMPHQASDAYMRQFAEYVRDHLDPNLKVYVEFSNEVWNWMFPQSQYAVKQAEARWGKDVDAGWMQWYGMRTAQMGQIWKSVFGAQANRVATVISTQTGWKGLENYILNTPAWVKEGNQPAWKSVDAYAVTGYFSGSLGSPENAETVKSWLKLPDGGFANALQQLRSGGLLKGADSIADTIASFQYHGEVARQHGLQFVAYEGGQHIVNTETIANTAADNAQLSDFFIALNRRPEMQQLYQELLTGWKAAGGTLFNHFVDVNRPSKYGSWGALENLNQTTSPKYAALTNFMAGNNRWWQETDSATKLGLYQRGGATNDVLTGGELDDIFLAGAGADTVAGGVGNDRIHGEPGNDQINGGIGNDRLVGGEGQDVLQGNEGDDQLNGTVGNDQLDGGLGKDIYQFKTGRIFKTADLGVDQLQFEVGRDRIELGPKTFTAGTTVAVIATDKKAATQSAFIVYSSETGNLFYNQNGTAPGFGTGARFATLANKPKLTAADLLNPVAARASTLSQDAMGTIVNDSLLGEAGDTLIGLASRDILIGGSGNDTISGGLGRDTLTGNAGADQFLYSGRSRVSALAGSPVRAPDRITDFNSVDGDRIRIDTDNFLETTETVKVLFNAGTQKGKTWVEATRSAFGDKNFVTRAITPLQAGEAVLFKWRQKTYLGINDTQQQFSASRDLAIDVTGIVLAAGDAAQGKLTTVDYFVG